MASIRSWNRKWQARIKRGAIVTEKSFINKRDAERWARQVESEIERGDYRPSKTDHSDHQDHQDHQGSAVQKEDTLHDLLDRYDLEVAPKHR
jgi:hypothetical protein